MRIFALVLLMTLACSAYADKLYKWVDENGTVNYSKTPPPPNARDAVQKNLGDNASQGDSMPYGLQQAVKNFPVVLYATDCGHACDEARAYLKKRGVPYAAKNPQQADALEKFKALVPDLQVPTLLVGKQTLKGYLESDWAAALDAAGYPSSPLPGVKLPAAATPDASAPAAASTATPATPTTDDQ